MNAYAIAAIYKFELARTFVAYDLFAEGRSKLC